MANDREKVLNEEFFDDKTLKSMRKLVEEWKSYMHVGDIYIDAFGNPTLCTKVNVEDVDIGLEGISLYDGSHPRGCGLIAQNIEKISVSEAWEMKIEYEKSKRSK